MDSTFWNFSVAIYGASGVESECLALQDQFGLDINLVLFCAFLGAVHGVALTPDDIAAVRKEVGPWHQNIVSTLRAARRHLKTTELQDAVAAKAAFELRARVKAAELESERIEQSMLERWAGPRLPTWSRSKPRDAVMANLQALLVTYGIGPERLTAATAMKNTIAAMRSLHA